MHGMCMARIIMMMALQLPFATVQAEQAPSLATSCLQMLIVPGFGNNHSHYSGCAIRHFQQAGAPDPSACRAACCAEDGCRSWGLDFRYPMSDSSCGFGKPCCWLERCTGLAPAHSTNCSYGCVSGHAGRADNPATCASCTAESCLSCPPAPAPPPPSACPHASAAANVARTSCDVKQVATLNYSACAAACCADTSCVAWNWDSVLPVGLAPLACRAAGAPYSCCWLKDCAGHDVPKRPGFDSWSGDSGHVAPTPHCPKGQVYRAGFKCVDPHDTGTPTGVPAGYDCEVRKHAWEFAKQTLPRRGEFKTVYDALQLWRCNVTAPAATDGYIPPRYATPTQGTVLFVDASATGDGNGSKAKPFATLEAGVDAAAAVNGAVTLVLRKGKYYTAGIVLTTAHSGLTIENFEGEEAVVSGAISVPVSQAQWSPHNTQTNTWKLDLSGWPALPAQTFGLRVGTERAIRARFPNGNPEVGDGYSMQRLTFTPRTDTADAPPIQNFFANPEDWPGVYWLAEPEGGCLPMAGENLGGTGHWYDSVGGGCGGRQAPFGYWCSDANSRGACPGDYFPHSVIPGGISFATDILSGGEAARAANWSKPRGAVYHIAAGFESVQCLVSKVENGSVIFDETQGCDQGPQAFQTGGLGWYTDNIKEECDSPGEYFLDHAEKALYYTFNGTDRPTGAEDFALTTTKVIFNISGTQASPVKNLTIRGLTIRDAALSECILNDAAIYLLCVFPTAM